MMDERETYCQSRYTARRRRTRTVMVGGVGVGGAHPVRIQSMTTTPTQDVDATVGQIIDLVRAECEIVRVTAQNITAARALKDIHRKVRRARIEVPLVADIHFLPNVAMEAANHVEKVRINPGNYADRKRFNVREYTDAQYYSELDRLYEEFSPIVKRCQELGRSMRIGTNHGSLSDRIMNRYGDTPLGMVESALEFIRIAESHGFKEIILSMKASNPKVMIQAYRLLVARMEAEGMAYPLHLGVTEAGDGEDARIKSAIGIGSLLLDGLGDTIRVSLTEDPVNEIPVARELADKAMRLWHNHRRQAEPEEERDAIDPFSFERRPILDFRLGDDCRLSAREPPRVIIPANRPIGRHRAIIADVCRVHNLLREARIEGLLIDFDTGVTGEDLEALRRALEETVRFFVINLPSEMTVEQLPPFAWVRPEQWMLLRRFVAGASADLGQFASFAQEMGLALAVDCDPTAIDGFAPTLKKFPALRLLFTCSEPAPNIHSTGCYRLLAQSLRDHRIEAPVWIRNTPANALDYRDYFGNRLLEAGILTGGLLCDGIGDLVSIETEPALERATALAYNILQGSRARITKTEFVACPSCGRTLFDLQSTTQRIREMTDHLKGVTIAVMGCIVNGPGEMADADFGYIGGAPGKVNLYVGKDCVAHHIPEERAVDTLIELIKREDRWMDRPLDSVKAELPERPKERLVLTGSSASEGP